MNDDCSVDIAVMGLDTVL